MKNSVDKNKLKINSLKIKNMYSFIKYAVNSKSRVLRIVLSQKPISKNQTISQLAIFNERKAKFICIKSHDFIQTFTLFKFYNSKQ